MSLSRQAKSLGWQDEAEDRPEQPPFRSQIWLSYMVTSQHLH